MFSQAVIDMLSKLTLQDDQEDRQAKMHALDLEKREFLLKNARNPYRLCLDLRETYGSGCYSIRATKLSDGSGRQINRGAKYQVLGMACGHS